MPKTETQNHGARSLADALAGRRTVERAGDFAPIAVFDKSGEYILGEYQGSRTVRPPGSKGFLGHNVKAQEWSCEFRRKEEVVAIETGQIVSLSGQVLDSAFEGMQPGTVVAIEYKGMGEKKTGRSPAKLFSVQEILGS